MRIVASLLLLLLAAHPFSAAAQDAPRHFAAQTARIDRAQAGRPLTPPSAAPAVDITRDYLRGRHGDEVLGSLVTAKEHQTRTALHVTLEQQVAGLRVHGASVRASLSVRGELLTVVDQLVPIPALVPARVGARDALEAVIRRYYSGAATPAEARASGNDVTFATTPLFPDAPSATRVAVPMASGALHEGYLVVTWDRDNVLRHTIVGGDGRVLIEELRTNQERYNVFTNHPGVTPQALVSGPGAGNTESQAGWMKCVSANATATDNTTIGNNVDAYLDRDKNNAADVGGRPLATFYTTSDCEFGTAANLGDAPTTTQNQKVAVANLFFLNNVIHDKLYRHGFTEAAGNFQANNFGKGGLGGDPVNAEAQDGGGTNNANFATPSDGSRPRMQMFLWTYSTPNRDGDLDSDIVYHEYGHGLTWRMIGSMSGPFAGAIGEGMSDTLAIYLNRSDVVGEYSYNNPKGIRRYVYTNYPLTYGNVTGSSVHADGEIYAATMWHLLGLWENGSSTVPSVGTQDQLFDYVVDGMNYTPARPAYEDMRNGILQAIAADAAAPAGAACAVWTAFAKFGIGEGADGVETCRIFTCSISVKQSFVVPAGACSTSTANTAPVVTITAPANGASYTQGTSVTFTGTVTDDHDSGLALRWTSDKDGVIGTTNSFSTSALSAGTHTITAAATDLGNLTGSAIVAVNIQPASGITLTARGYKTKGTANVDLAWTGAQSETMRITRNGTVVASSTPNDGAHTDTIGKGGGSFTYQVCETGTGGRCSNQVTVTF